jgi:hypothetical protein
LDPQVSPTGEDEMCCDFSLETYKSRAAVKDEDLVVRKFPSGCKGFVDLIDADCAVCCKSGVEMTLHLSGTFLVMDGGLEGPLYRELSEELFTGPISVFFRTQPGNWPGLFRDGFILEDGTFLNLQYLPEGTRATVTKALPIEIAEAIKGDIAFEPELRVDLEAQPRPVRQLFRRLFRLPAD